MVVRPIPRWLAALDEEKPYIEVLDGERLPDVSPKDAHGFIAFRIGKRMDVCLNDLGEVGVEIRFYFERPDGSWSSLLPDACFKSYARFPSGDINDDLVGRPRIAPDISVEVLSPGDRPARTARKVATYLAHGATLVIVVDSGRRHVALHRAGGSVEEREARGAMRIAPYDHLVIDWDEVYRGVVL
jgi:Uma2 family endonuclease